MVFRRSSAVEQLTVNQLVVGSIPTAGATFLNKINSLVFFGAKFGDKPFLTKIILVTNKKNWR